MKLGAGYHSQIKVTITFIHSYIASVYVFMFILEINQVYNNATNIEIILPTHKSYMHALSRDAN